MAKLSSMTSSACAVCPAARAAIAGSASRHLRHDLGGGAGSLVHGLPPIGLGMVGVASTPPQCASLSAWAPPRLAMVARGHGIVDNTIRGPAILILAPDFTLIRKPSSPGDSIRGGSGGGSTVVPALRRDPMSKMRIAARGRDAGAPGRPSSGAAAPPDARRSAVPRPAFQRRNPSGGMHLSDPPVSGHGRMPSRPSASSKHAPAPCFAPRAATEAPTGRTPCRTR